MNLNFSFSLFDRKARSHDAARAALPKTGGQAIYGSAIRHPVWSRSQSSAAMDYADSFKRAYDAAVTTNLNVDFVPTFGNANAEILNSLPLSRGRARTLSKDFPTAKGMLRSYKNNVCGDDPFRLEMKVGSWSADGKTFTLDNKINRAIKEAWEDYKLPENLTTRGDMNYMELCQLVETSALRDGSILGRHHRDFPFNKYHYAIEMIESDRLQESYQGRAPKTGNPIRFSIERDRVYKRPVAYWILSRHPGDVFNDTDSPNLFRARVDANDIIHFNNLRDRAEQDIGFPEFDSVMQTLHRARQFDIAHATAATQSCAKPWWIKKEFPTGMTFAGDPSMVLNPNVGGSGQAGEFPDNEGDGKGGGVDKIELTEPGTARVLDYGFDLKQLDPKFPVDSATNFRRDSHLDVATGIGLSYGAVSSDYEKYSFSVARFACQPERDNFKVRQEKMIVDFVRVHFNNWLKNAILSGALDLPFTRYEEFCKAANFHAKRWPYIQPVQDVQADGMSMELNLKSRQEILSDSENGRTVDDIDSDTKASNESLKSHGLPIPGDATMPTVKKGEPGQEQPPPDGQQPPGQSRHQMFTRVPIANGEHHEFR